MTRSLLALALAAVALVACGSRPGLADCSLDADCGTGICEGGRCAIQACNPGLTPCGRRCVNFQADEADCGGCGFACSTQCVRAVCQPKPCFQTLGFPSFPAPLLGPFASAAVTADFANVAPPFGAEDLLVASSQDATLWLVISDGTSFRTTTATLPAPAAAMVAADFDLDGRPDAGVSLQDGTLLLLAGHDDGVFTVGGSFAASGGGALAAGDFDRDGVPDLVSAPSGGASLLRGQRFPAFTFAAALPLGLPALVHALRAEDVDGDGHLDVVAGLSDGSAAILFGDGLGAFSAAVPLTAGAAFPVEVAVGDFDGDGRNDVAVASAQAAGVVIHRGLPGRTFAGGSHAACSEPTSLAALPLAGGTSLAVGCQGFRDDGVVLLSPDGAGGIGTRRLAGGSPVARLATGQFGSGNQDLAAIVGRPGDVHLAVRLASDGNSLAASDYRPGPTNRAVTTADLDGDRRVDVVVADGFGNTTIGVFLNSAQGLGARVSHTVGDNPYWVAIGDLNGDGILDLAVANNGTNSIGVLLGQGGGRFGPQAPYGVGSSPRAVAIAELNGDGRPDLVSINNGSADVSVLIGNGNGTFRAPVSYPVGFGPYFLATADLDGDGKVDVVSVNAADDNVGVLRGRGDGTLEAQVTYPTGPNPHHVVPRDLDGDGRLDLVVANDDATPGAANGVSVLLALAGGGFAPHVDYEIGGRAYSLTLADLDGDGRLDAVVAQDGSNGVVAVLPGGAGGTFGATRYHPFFGGDYVAVADVNGDMAPDILSSGSENLTLGYATCR